MNAKRVRAFAAETAGQTFISLARYYGTTAPSEETLCRLRLTSLNDHGGCKSALYLAVGAPVVVNDNLHTAQGVTNGAYGTVVKIVLDLADAMRLAAKPSDATHNFVLSKPAPCVVVR